MASTLNETYTNTHDPKPTRDREAPMSRSELTQTCENDPHLILELNTFAAGKKHQTA
jgi:hypothetical protein